MMDFSTLPFVPRYKSFTCLLLSRIGFRLCKEDLVEDVYTDHRKKARTKIATFLEKEQYVLQNEFFTYKNCGLVCMESGYNE